MTPPVLADRARNPSVSPCALSLAVEHERLQLAFTPGGWAQTSWERMRLLVGDDTGLLKRIEVSEVSTIDEEGGSTKSASVTHRWGRQGREERVARMCWAGGNTAARSEEFVVAHVGGRLELRNTDTTQSVMSWQAPAVEGTADDVRGLAVSGSAEHDWRLVSCTESGIVRTWRRHDEGETGGCDTEWATCGLSGKPLGDANMVSRMRVDRVSCSRLALGGREKELAVWDVATQKVLYTAKNVKNDNLQLRVPVWNVDLDFRSGSENELLALTAAREIRHYDMRLGQRRPLYSVPIDGTKMDVGDCRFNAMALYGDYLAICGDVVGGLSMFDLRKRISVGAMAGGGGSVRDISVDEERGMICCCGADRYVRVYSIKSMKQLQLADGPKAEPSVVRSGKKMLHKLYLKQRVNAVLVVPPHPSKGSGFSTSRLSASSKTASGSNTKGKKTKTSKGKGKSSDDIHTVAATIDHGVVDPLAAMDAAFGPTDHTHEPGAADEADDGSDGDEIEDEDSDDEDSDDGTDDDDGDDSDADADQDEDDELVQDDAAKTETVAAEENDDDFMQWVLGGAAAAEELENVVPAGEASFWLTASLF